MRSRKEIAFRLKQEFANLWMNAWKPAPLLSAVSPLLCLPDPAKVAAAVRGTAHATSIELIAEAVLQGNVPVLDRVVRTDHPTRWRLDSAHQVESPLQYFRRVPYLDFHVAGEHRLVWELNRHHHLVVLAQAHLLNGRSDYIAELARQIESWLLDNPFQQGINWTSALEVAFRALSWMWIWHLCGGSLPEDLRQRFLVSLYQHGLYLEYNLSVYFSPNTHLQGEALALTALGRAFPDWPRAEHWRKTGTTIMLDLMQTQVRADGTQFEQSSFYHLYALDMFLFGAILMDSTESYREGLRRMADYVAALMGPAGVLPLIGDDDGGRLFHAFGPPGQFGRATLATTAAFLQRRDLPFGAADSMVQAVWWLGPDACRESSPVPRRASTQLFSDAGMVILAEGEAHVTVDCGPFGAGSGGHSHSDTLSLTVSLGEEELLIDAGTFAYSDPAWRDRFRGSAGHNTVRIAGRDQAVPINAFRWQEKPEVRIQQWDAASRLIEASCAYGGFRHTRRVRLRGDVIFIIDKIEGPPGEWLLEQFWHPAAAAQDSSGVLRIGHRSRLIWSKGSVEYCEEGGEHGWRSRGFGSREPATVLCLKRTETLPVVLAAALELRPSAEPSRLEWTATKQLEYWRGSEREIVD